MKYMTIISQTQPDGTVNAAMTVHDEYQKAVSAFHMELAYGAVSDKLASDMAMLAERHGNARRHHRTRVRDLRRAGSREAGGDDE